jgi:hypothetical protein
MLPVRSWFVILVLAAVPAIAQLSAPVAMPTANSVPEGTTFLVRLDDKLDTATLKPGKHFKAKLAEDLLAPNGAVVPRGKKVKGHVSSIEPGVHARMLLSFDEIETEHGWMPLIATLTGVPGEHAAKQPDSEGMIERKGMSTPHMIEAVAVGAGVGAGAGAAAGGGHGAAVGAGVGAGVGALSGFLADHDLRLEKGTVLELRLDRALQVPMH